MSQQTTTIRLSAETADELHNRKRRGDSYDDVVQRLIDQEQEEIEV